MARIKKKGTASSGRTVTRKASGRSNLPVLLTNRPMFVFLFHPKRWGVLLGSVVPLLKELRFVDDPNVDPDDERAKWRKRGWVEIPWNVRGDGTNYMVEHDGPMGTMVYLSEFETPHRGSRVVVPNQGAYVEFLVWLKDNQMIAEPEIYILEDLKDRALKRFEDYAGKAHANPKVQSLADKARADMDALGREIDILLGVEVEPLPEPKKKTRKKKTVEVPSGSEDS
jgi:hypothetical protein